ncbi:hypothetical protein TWF106_007206 [Orbilia oligospora]|uniref:DUF7704 domain-containing protein n=1 Tax=Orbilia oligospora TaxID=2813651 RepID=A0A7C8V150_ORBOL|nr:hypothetical protein TWF788_000451 [Orbilia oligospora]KAF3219092.1 hypothetical protein TWF106_007206 [Orbilia oligospora]
MATLLPTVPYLVFCVSEPVSLVVGFAIAIFQPEQFVRLQLPNTSPTDLSPSGKLIAWQTGNLFGIMAMMGIAILFATTEVVVVKRYLVALLLGDIGHLTAVWWVMGSYEFFSAHRWNWFTWGNVGITFLLALVRIGTLVGLFGEIKLQPSTVGKVKVKRK